MTNTTLHPRSVADKSRKENLERAISLALAVESEAVRHNTQTFNRNRYAAVSEIEDYESLKDRAREIKERAIEALPKLITRVRQSVETNGGHVFLAEDAAQARDYIREVCLQHQARTVVKSKSMTSEEIRLNDELEDAGLEVVETDLAEFILQVSGEQPSHIVAPAIHRSRERISQLFKEKFETDHPLDSGEDLTRFARDILREKFLTADVGISGANAIAADTGTLLLVESEGNIRMVTQAPPVHIAVAGLEKIVPGKLDLLPFLELLAPSGTGQPLSSYTNILRPPLSVPVFDFRGRAKKSREFHLVLVDNGRLKMRSDPVLREALYCIRCSACLNVCANFQVLGGHAFGGETYSGGIGAAWEAGTRSLEAARFCELCSGCSRCVPQCPVRINIPLLNAELRQRLSRLGNGKAKRQKHFFAGFASRAKMATMLPKLTNKILSCSPTQKLVQTRYDLHPQRTLPKFPEETLQQAFKKWEGGSNPAPDANLPLRGKKVMLFCDVFTNYIQPQVGMAAVRLLTSLGAKVTLSQVMDDGRSAFSQGFLDKARRQARRVIENLKPLLSGYQAVIVLEPSVLAMFRLDYRSLLGDDSDVLKLQKKSVDCFEWLAAVWPQGEPLDSWFAGGGKTLFLHGHCQQKTINAHQAQLDLFQKLGFRVNLSAAECCGMAGSFGYKRSFFDVSRKVSQGLVDEIRAFADRESHPVVLAPGISCREQLTDLIPMPAIHPVVFLYELRRERLKEGGNGR